MRKRMFPLLLALGIGLSLTGCGTLSRDPDIPLIVHVDEQKTLLVQGEKIALEALPKRLKALGAGPRQQIEVHARSEIDRELIGRITAVLATHGYRRLIFIGKRKAASRVEPAQ